ncbi:DUF2975 domain-containing protein [Brevundimonas sp. GCM10030266]|uniref:DUF2975 domain-containing protein n=1 Tax=Brevundimonas sp. GCM10030266 TaxID=3273386 RepID=UPI00361B2924
MSQTETARFRLMCRQFNWLAIFMVCSVGALLVLANGVGPFVHWMRTDAAAYEPRYLKGVIWTVPAVCYLFGVWAIGSAMGQLAKGRLIQPTLSDALRKVGLALGIGGVFSVFVMSNLIRLVEGGRGGYLHFDVASMTLGMIGGALFLLGRVMEQADRVQAELDEMI